MALNNILDANMNNIYSNSLTMNLAQTQPIAGNNTLWLNASNNHLYRDGVDLETSQTPATLSTFITATSWDVRTGNGVTSNDGDAAEDPYLKILFNTPGSIYVAFNPVQGNMAPNLKLARIDFVYRVVSGPSFNPTVYVFRVQYTNNSINTSTAIPFTGTFNTPPSPSTYISSILITTPVVLAENQKLNVVVDISGGTGRQINMYGCFCYFNN